MTPIEWAGWLITGVLGILLLIQFENTRTFITPRKPKRRDSWPSVAIVVRLRAADRSARPCIASLAGQDYEGDLEIVLLNEQPEDRDGSVIEQLTIAHPSVRVTRTTSEEHWRLTLGKVANDASADYLLLAGPDTIHDPDSVAASIGYAEDYQSEVVSLMPRHALESAAQRLLVPALHFFRLTFPWATVDPSRRIEEQPCGFVIVRRDAIDRLDIDEAERLHLDVLDGRFLVECRLHSGESVERKFVQGLSPSLTK
ncbi:MAG: glycosyltransferase family 2 protein, partial [Thermoanaerobaculia bacterium]|nr:glycosyltransferase family 2 protein [Thermoanaerobaculia bacterium]